MFSREESKKIRQEFWTSFGRNQQRKWILYNTGIKDFSLKFTFTQKLAEVSIDLESSDEILGLYYFERLQSLETILRKEYLPELIFAPQFELENGKQVARIYVRKEGVNIHNKKDWPEVQEWLAEKMDVFENFFFEYKDFIQQ